MIVLICVGILYAISWLITCGLVKLITLCFGLGFSWLVATGVWLLLILIRGIIKE